MFRRVLQGLVVCGMLAVWATGGGSETCPITDETAAFAMVAIQPTAQGGMTLIWESCTDHVYEVQAAMPAAGRFTWDLLAVVVGQAGRTSWTDNNARTPGNRLYRIRRQWSSEDADGDGIPNGWELQFGLDPLAPADAHTCLVCDGSDNLTKYREGRDPTKGAVADSNGVLNLQIFTPQE